MSVICYHWSRNFHWLWWELLGFNGRYSVTWIEVHVSISDVLGIEGIFRGLVGPLGDLFLLEWQLEDGRETQSHLSCYLDTSLWQLSPFLHWRSSYCCPWPWGCGWNLQSGFQNTFTAKEQLTAFPFQQSLINCSQCCTFPYTERGEELPAIKGSKFSVTIKSICLCMGRRGLQ